MFGGGSFTQSMKPVHKYEHLRTHPCPHKRMHPTSVAEICCLNSATHRLNNSRLSLLSLLAASTVDLHTKRTQANTISSPSSRQPPHPQDHVLFYCYFSPVHNTHWSQQADCCPCQHLQGHHMCHTGPNHHTL